MIWGSISLFLMFFTQYLYRHTCYCSSSAEKLTLKVVFPRSGIWGKLGTGVKGICLKKSWAKFPPNCTMCSKDAIRPQPFCQNTEIDCSWRVWTVSLAKTRKFQVFSPCGRLCKHTFVIAKFWNLVKIAKYVQMFDMFLSLHMVQ